MVETNIVGVFVPWLEQPEFCIGCAKCASVCVAGGIQMTSYVDEAFERFKTKRPTLPIGDS